MRPSIPKHGCPCLKPDHNRVLQNQTYLLVHTFQRKHPNSQRVSITNRQTQVLLLREERAPSKSRHGCRMGARGAESAMKSHPNTATSHDTPTFTSPQAYGRRCGGRQGVIYTPPAAQLARRKEPRGREAPPPPRCKHCSWAGGCQGSSSPCTPQAALIPVGFPPKPGTSTQ